MSQEMIRLINNVHKTSLWTSPGAGPRQRPQQEQVQESNPHGSRPEPETSMGLDPSQGPSKKQAQGRDVMGTGLRQ